MEAKGTPSKENVLGPKNKKLQGESFDLSICVYVVMVALHVTERLNNWF